MIRAHCQTDDQQFEAMFDATPWFEGATDDEICKLAACGWAGDYPADAVAEFFEGRHPDVTRLFAYLSLEPRASGQAVGFECCVNSPDALAWLRQHRPTLCKQLKGAV